MAKEKKTRSLVIRKGANDTAYGAVKRAVILKSLAESKTYELLHKQIWRKARDRVWTYQLPVITSHIDSTGKPRPVLFIRGWNYISPSRSPYSYDTAIYPSGDTDMRFGLNQLFVGGDPSKVYEHPVSGSHDPADNDGIYHDDCYAQPKAMKLLSGLVDQWIYREVEYGSDGADTVRLEYIFDKQNPDGSIKTNNVELEVYDKTVNGKIVQYRRLNVDSAKFGAKVYELGVDNDLTGQLDFVKNPNKQWIVDQAAYEATLVEEYGRLIGRYPTGVEGHPVFLGGSTVPAIQSAEGYVLYFASGVVIEYVPYVSTNYGDGASVDDPAHYKLLPMVYADTGDLVMKRKDFVRNWDEKFELIVHEKRSFWQRILKPVLVIITIIIAYYTGVDMSSVFAQILLGIGTALTVIGIMSGNSKMMAIGALFSVAAAVTNALTTTATNAMSTETAMAVAQSIPEEVFGAGGQFGELFAGFPSSAGLENGLGMSLTGTTPASLYTDAYFAGAGAASTTSLLAQSTANIGVSAFSGAEVIYPALDVAKEVTTESFGAAYTAMSGAYTVPVMNIVKNGVSLASSVYNAINAFKSTGYEPLPEVEDESSTVMFGPQWSVESMDPNEIVNNIINI